MPKALPKVATPRASRTLTIICGPLSVGIAMKPLTRNNTIYAKTLCGEHLSPAKQSWVCEAHGHTIDEPVKRYVHGDAYVEIDDARLLEVDKDYAVTLVAAPEEVDPIYIEKSYLLWPQAGYEAQFDMLAAAIMQTGRTLIGTVVLTKQTRVMAVRWSETFGLVAHTLHYDEDVAHTDVDLVAGAYADRPEADAQYVDLVSQLVETTMPAEFEASAFVDDYRLNLAEAIASAANGMPIPRLEPDVPVEHVPDLLAALKASVDANVKPKARATKKPAAKAPARKPAPRKAAPKTKTATALRRGRKAA